MLQFIRFIQFSCGGCTVDNFYSCFGHVSVVFYMNKVISKTNILVCSICFRREKEHEGLLPHNWHSNCEKDQETCY